jgi:serine/threonine protein phosphatase 1
MAKNTIIAIGDIHGEYLVLNKMLELLDGKYNLKKVQLVFQELTDRGLNSQVTIKMIRQFKKKYPQTVVIQSNHDELNSQNDYYGLENLESAALDYDKGQIYKRDREFLENLPLFYETENFIFLHGGLSKGIIHPNEETAYNILWNSGTHSSYNGNKRLVMGHTVREEIIETPKLIYIDTGATFYFGRKLSAVVLDDKTRLCEEKISLENFSIYDKSLRQEVYLRRKAVYEKYFLNKKTN